MCCYRLTSADAGVLFAVAGDLKTATVVPEWDLISVVAASDSSTITGAGASGRSAAAWDASADTRPDDVFDAEPCAATQRPPESTQRMPVTDGCDITSSTSFFRAFSIAESTQMRTRNKFIEENVFTMHCRDSDDKLITLL